MTCGVEWQLPGWLKSRTALADLAFMPCASCPRAAHRDNLQAEPVPSQSQPFRKSLSRKDIPTSTGTICTENAITPAGRVSAAR
jgi:hypothetical protein